MKYNKIIVTGTGIAFALMTALPALAEDSTTTAGTTTVRTDSGEMHTGFRVGLPNLHFLASTTRREDMKEGDGHHGTSTENRIANGQQRGENMIDARIKSLQGLLDRISKMKLLSPSDVASIQASITAEIQTLTDLKAKIGSDTSTTTLKSDDQEITKANRVYLVVLPKAHIAASADRVNAVVAQMQAFSTKLEARITASQTAGVDVSAAATALTDYNAKVADAKVQADAAVAETANLAPDNGEATIKASNKAALKDAQAKLKKAETDLRSARADARVIVGVVEKKDTQNTASTTP